MNPLIRALRRLAGALRLTDALPVAPAGCRAAVVAAAGRAPRRVVLAGLVRPAGSL